MLSLELETDELIFLSTPSARRATICTADMDNARSISIHALREEGDGGCCRACKHPRISIHALREEGDAGTHRSRCMCG